MFRSIEDAMQAGNYSLARKLLDDVIIDGEYASDLLAVYDAGLCQIEENPKGMFEAIKKGLAINERNFELYYLLGFYYCYFNVNQAYLCFQNALFYCCDESDKAEIASTMKELIRRGNVTVKDITIVIVSYNGLYLQQKNIESIRTNLPKGTYHIVVVDNASTDGVCEWLEEQPDVWLVKNTENKGFSVACNQAVSEAKKRFAQVGDIYLLNNDTRLTPNALFYLRMGLYENDEIGATGSIANYAGNNQEIRKDYPQIADYIEFAKKNNIPMEQPYEERVRLSGFSMLIKEEVWEKTGGMDEDFAPGYFEDDALSMHILKCGYRMLVCKNSYIYHAGSQSFSKVDGLEELLLSHHRLFIEKFGFDILQYAYADKSRVDEVKVNEKGPFFVLQIGSKLGADLKFLKSQYPHIKAVGIEKEDAIYRIASRTEEVYQSTDALPENKGYRFDALFVRKEDLAKLTLKEKTKIAMLCKNTCQIIVN